MVDVEELPRAERKDHTLVVLLQLIIHLRGDQSRKLSLGKRLILVKSLAVTANVSGLVQRDRHFGHIGGSAYI